MICYPDKVACHRRQSELTEIERLLYLKTKEISNKMSEVQKEKMALTAILEMEQQQQVIEVRE